jgi:hypothetical protein
MRNVNNKIMSASNTGTQVSAPIDANQLISASFVATFTDGAAAGTLKLQCSNDPVSAGAGNVYSAFTPTNWVDVPGSTATAAVSSGANAVIYLPANFCARHLRVSFTSSAGAGTFIVNMDGLSA